MSSSSSKTTISKTKTKTTNNKVRERAKCTVCLARSMILLKRLFSFSLFFKFTIHCLYFDLWIQLCTNVTWLFISYVDRKSRCGFSMSHCQNIYQQVKWQNFGEFPYNPAGCSCYLFYEINIYALNESLVNCKKWNILLSHSACSDLIFVNQVVGHKGLISFGPESDPWLE
jgi:hypothetical protein